MRVSVECYLFLYIAGNRVQGRGELGGKDSDDCREL